MHDRKRHGAAAAKAHVRRELGRDATAATNVSPLPLPVFSSSAAASAADVARPSVHPGYSSCARACVRASARPFATLQSPLRPLGGSVDSLPLLLLHLRLFLRLRRLQRSASYVRSSESESDPQTTTTVTRPSSVRGGLFVETISSIFPNSSPTHSSIIACFHRRRT